ncbi:MAG: ComF family protein [Fusobacteriaceae bacterium]
MCNCFLDDDEEYLCLECLSYLEEEGKIKKIENCYYSYFYNAKIKNFIENYKLKNQKKLGAILSKILKLEIEKIIQIEGIDSVIPVPISDERLRERGFNQVQEVLEKAGINYKKIERIKNTKQMYKLGGRERRRENIKKGFRIGVNDFNGKNLLIVDDIITTGSTVEEIIEEIHNSCNPKKIIVYTFSLAVKNVERNRDVAGSLYRQRKI